MTWGQIFGGVAFFYIAGAALTFVLNQRMGNITPPLIIMRCIVWPYWMITGKPDGQSLGPD